MHKQTSGASVAPTYLCALVALPPGGTPYVVIAPHAGADDAVLHLRVRGLNEVVILPTRLATPAQIEDAVAALIDDLPELPHDVITANLRRDRVIASIVRPGSVPVIVVESLSGSRPLPPRVGTGETDTG